MWHLLQQSCVSCPLRRLTQSWCYQQHPVQLTLAADTITTMIIINSRRQPMQLTQPTAQAQYLPAAPGITSFA